MTALVFYVQFAFIFAIWNPIMCFILLEMKKMSTSASLHFFFFLLQIKDRKKALFPTCANLHTKGEA